MTLKRSTKQQKMAKDMVDMCSDDKGMKNLLYEFEGQLMTRKQIARHPRCEVTYDRLCTKLRSGMSVEDAIRNEKNRNKRRYLYKGKMMTVAEMLFLPECKVSRSCLVNRLARGMNPEDAVQKKMRVRKPKDNDIRKEEGFYIPSVDPVAEGRMTQEERDHWDEWLATPLNVIIKRCEEYWDGKPMKEVETVGEEYQRNRRIKIGIE